MLDDTFSIQDDFASVGYDDWREIVERDLKGAPFEKKLVTRTYEGVDLQPVYTSADWQSEGDPVGFPGFEHFLRGSKPLGAAQSGWDLQQQHAHPDLSVTNKAITADLNGGVTSVLLHLDSAARNGLDADDPAAKTLAGRDGIAAYHIDDLGAALQGVKLPMVGVALKAGAAFTPAAGLLAALWKRRGVTPEDARGGFNADPLAALACDGQLPMSTGAALSLLGELAAWTSEVYPRVKSVCVSTADYHHAGASAIQDIAFAMATGVEYLRAMVDGKGMAVDAAAKQMVFSICVGTHHFLSIAKLRAARSLWSRVVQASGGSSDAAAMRLHSQVSNRVLTKRDPYVNMLRNTVAVFAAGLGGANSITSTPFDSTLGLPDERSRRIARNAFHVLQEESHLNRVVDPAGGSWYLDHLTDQLAGQAWGILQNIERQGGMLRALESGWVAEQIESAFTSRAKGIASRKEGITGVSEFPNLEEEPVVCEEPDLSALRSQAATRLETSRCSDSLLKEVANSDRPMPSAVHAALEGASIGQLSRALGLGQEEARIEPLQPRPFAQPFEELRDASDQWLERNGARPRVFLANMGTIAHHTARATFSKNFFGAGGFDVVTNNGFAHAEAASAAMIASGAQIAIICSSDKLYPEIVPDLAGKLKAAGARTIVLAGHPGKNESAWREAGVDRFIYIKCDVLATLRDLLREEGVLPS